MGERLDRLASKEKLTLAATFLLLGPQAPMIFMGEEWGTQTPFLYFCDFQSPLADKVREGRQNEFKNTRAFADPELATKIPDPNEETTFRASCLNWQEQKDCGHTGQLAFTSRMLDLRRQYVLPLLQSKWKRNQYQIKDGGLEVRWQFNRGNLCVLANFSDDGIKNISPASGTSFWGVTDEILPAWHSVWHIEKCDD
jgi:1,4-alpha-glucan branching enzyme/maltooligosyltrehalose trehalohydrolase